ncbi:hypothetical protein PV458_37420 [Streptomyces sp. MN03-5084-2B]|nr:hypothetical protein [Streptomyces sp. MN03-5084-2B]
MADYDCWALWILSNSGTENVAPADPRLGLSSALVHDLNRWSDEYTATLDRDDPMASGFPSDAVEQAFVARGHRLAEEVRAQVSPDWRVIYYDSERGRDVEVESAS